MRPVFTKIFCVIAIIIIPILSNSQNKNQSEMLERLRQINEQTLNKINQLRQEVNRKYYEAIGKPWTYTKGTPPKTNPLDLDTPILPVPYDATTDYPGTQTRIESTAVYVDLEHIGNTKTRPRFEGNSNLNDKIVNIIVNGLEVSLRLPKNGLTSISSTSEKEVASAWAKMAETPYDNTLRDLFRIREALKMSDWSFIRTIETLSAELYGTASSNVAIIFQTFILNQMGFLMSLARSSEGNLYKMFATDMDVIGYPSYIINGCCYYMFKEKGPEELSVVTLDLNGEQPVQLRFNSNELFFSKYSEKKTFASQRYPNISVSVSSDLNKMKHYEEYPLYFSGKDVLTAFYYHAMVPLSDEVKASVYPVLKQAVEGKNEVEATDILLDFVQTAFTYEFDNVVWGKERYLYADEIWCYNRSDCEDRSILFSNLVRDILGLKVALVYWPGHLSCAVHFNQEVKGTAFIADDMTYVSCDPTFIGAGHGAIMDAVKDLPAKLIPLP